MERIIAPKEEKCFACGNAIEKGKEMFWEKPILRFYHVACFEAGQKANEQKSGVSQPAGPDSLAGLRKVLSGSDSGYDAKVRGLVKEEIRKFALDPEGYLK